MHPREQELKLKKWKTIPLTDTTVEEDRGAKMVMLLQAQAGKEPNFRYALHYWRSHDKRHQEEVEERFYRILEELTLKYEDPTN